MSRKQFRDRLRGLLEADDFAAIQAIWEEVSQKRKQTIWVESYEAKVDEKGKVISRRTRKVPVEAELYSIKDAIAFMGLAASFGVGKPPEEKTLNINVNQQIEQMTDAELAELARAEDADFRALPAGD